MLALDACPEAPARARSLTLVDRRRRGEPLQHVVGHWGFRSLDLLVDGRALVPRPETEFTVEVALAEIDGQWPSGHPLLAVELGTGSGAIACSLVVEREALRVIATDLSPAALAIAKLNRARLDPGRAGRIEFRSGDWYEALDPGIAGKVDLIVANPPYVAASEWHDLDPVVRDFDPRAALVAGESGREAIEEVLRGAPDVAGGWGRRGRRDRAAPGVSCGGVRRRLRCAKRRGASRSRPDGTACCVARW